ncbi:MAG TPA: glycosyltransferase [Vicinamibacterales bacterium]|nr:glycosyltransferase [Vicinamibacterales bacterium]
MRIGTFGNTNNYPLLLALGLRQLGHDAVLVVNRKERLHRPESKYPEFEQGYPNWIMDCSDLAEEDFVAASPRIERVLNFLSAGSSGLILNDLGPSLLEFCPLPSVALMTGSDVTHYAHPGTVSLRYQGSSAEYLQSPGARLGMRKWAEFIQRQRAGIRSATVVSAPFPGLVPAMDDLLREIGVAEAKRDFFYMADTDSVRPRCARDTGPLRVVNGARLNWKEPLPQGFSSLDLKGTDILLKGFAEFVSLGGEAELVLFRKGLHVGETETLAETLGIGSRIVWREQVDLSEFHDEISRADIVCDQLAGAAFPGMVALDAMALGLPVIANFRPEIFDAHFPRPVAGCQARTPSEVASHLKRLASSAGARASAGRAAQGFARRYLSPAANAVKCVRHLRPLPKQEIQ